MNLDITGLRVLVTAGAGGIGREIAHAFIGEGAKVHIRDVDQKALGALAKIDRKGVKRLFKKAIKALGGLDVLVNNAGVAGPTGVCTENLIRR